MSVWVLQEPDAKVGFGVEKIEENICEGENGKEEPEYVGRGLGKDADFTSMKIRERRKDNWVEGATDYSAALKKSLSR